MIPRGRSGANTAYAKRIVRFEVVVRHGIRGTRQWSSELKMKENHTRGYEYDFGITELEIFCRILPKLFTA